LLDEMEPPMPTRKLPFPKGLNFKESEIESAWAETFIEINRNRKGPKKFLFTRFDFS